MTHKEELEVELKGITEMMLEEKKKNLSLNNELKWLIGKDIVEADYLNSLDIEMQIRVVPLRIKILGSDIEIMKHKNEIRRLEAEINTL